MIALTKAAALELKLAIMTKRLALLVVALQFREKPFHWLNRYGTKNRPKLQSHPTRHFPVERRLNIFNELIIFRKKRSQNVGLDQKLLVRITQNEEEFKSQLLETLGDSWGYIHTSL